MSSEIDEDASCSAKVLKQRLADFAYSPEKARNDPTMSRSRRAAPIHQGEPVTGIEETVETSRSTSVEAIEDKTPEKQTPTRKRGKMWLDADFVKKPRLSKTPSAQAVPAENNLKDSIRPGLILISIGLNPGIMTGKLGHAYAHPSNRYWPTLFASGVIPLQHKPEETFSLMDLYGIGHTNIVSTKATRGGNDLTKDDYMRGAEELDQKILENRPQAVMVVGKGVWEAWFQFKKGRKMNSKDNFKYGWQDPKLNIGRKKGVWDGAETFVVTTTSGLSSSHTKEERIAIWKPIGEWFAPKREEWIRAREEQAQSKVS